MVKYCIDCGRELTSGKICRFCGCDQKNFTPRKGDVIQEMRIKQNADERKKTRLTIILIVGMIIVILSVLFIMISHASRYMEIAEQIKRVGAD